MAKQDLKKVNHAGDRYEVVENVVSIRKLKSLSQEKKEEIIQELLAKKELTQTPAEKACPFPQHKGYVELWKSLTPDQQKEMKENIKITADGKVEIIKMKKKFSQLTAQHNGKDIFDGSHVDKNGNIGIKGVTYLTGRAAEQEAKNQDKKLLKNRAEVEGFISFFPGENTKEKICNSIKLFSLEKSGCWSLLNLKWCNVGSVGYVYMSGVNENVYVYGITWHTGNANINQDYQEFPSPFLAFEDC